MLSLPQMLWLVKYVRAKVVPGRSWSAIALSTGQSNAGMRCVFWNSPALSGMSNCSRAQRQKVPAPPDRGIEDCGYSGRVDKLERHGVIKSRLLMGLHFGKEQSSSTSRRSGPAKRHL